MLAEVMQASAGHSSTPPRAPSRVGFMRPQLRRQHAYTNLAWAEKIDELDDEKDWEFASMLLMPFEPSASDDSDVSLDDANEDEPQSQDQGPCKPALPITSEPVVLLDSVESSAHSDSEFGEHALPSVVPEDIHGHAYISLAVTDHGMSRSALSTLKEFWHSRFDEYARIESQVMHSTAYGGIIEASRSREALRAVLVSRLASPKQPSPPTQPPAPAPSSNAPIYPRTGNLTTLRDSRSATLDRAFSNYPLHNIHKTLFLHDMLERATIDSCHSRPSSPTEDSTSDADLHSPTDDTFVDISLSSSGSDASDSILSDAEPASLCSSHGCGTRTSGDSYQSAVLHTAECTRQWEIDWTERWKILLSSTKDDSLCFRLSSYCVDEVTFRSAFSTDKPKARFYFAEEEDEFAGLDDDADDNEDYGLVLAQPVYRVTAETLSKEYMRSLERSVPL